MLEFNFTKLDPSLVKIEGREFAIENRETGDLYFTNKGYMDKLFRELGYRNLNVVKILEDYANKTISDIESLEMSNVFIDKSKGTFIVAPDSYMSWIKDMINYLDDKIVSERKLDEYFSWNQYIVKSKDNYFAIYVDMVRGYVRVYALDYDINAQDLKGMSRISDYRLDSPEDFSEFIFLLENPTDISYMFNPSVPMSSYEYVELLRILGLVRRKRNKVYVPTADDDFFGLVEDLDDVNSMTWILQRVTPYPGNPSFADVCKLIGASVDRINLDSVYHYYERNSTETSDMFLC